MQEFEHKGIGVERANKVCTVCTKVKSLTLFNINTRGNPMGWCTDCEAKHAAIVAANIASTKDCYKCGEAKSLKEFERKKNGTMRGTCRKCRDNHLMSYI